MTAALAVAAVWVVCGYLAVTVARLSHETGEARKRENARPLKHSMR